MSHSTDAFTPVSQPTLVPSIVGKTLADRLAALFTRDQLDAVIDRAARVSRATVAVFAASPVESGGAVGIEFVVEFFVPPTSPEIFQAELEAELLAVGPQYATGRYRGDFAPCSLHSVGCGTFHQYRVTCRANADDHRQARWSRDRMLLNGILNQARTGWRELEA